MPDIFTPTFKPLYKSTFSNEGEGPTPPPPFTYGTNFARAEFTNDTYQEYDGISTTQTRSTSIAFFSTVNRGICLTPDDTITFAVVNSNILQVRQRSDLSLVKTLTATGIVAAGDLSFDGTDLLVSQNGTGGVFVKVNYQDGTVHSSWTPLSGRIAQVIAYNQTNGNVLMPSVGSGDEFFRMYDSYGGSLIASLNITTNIASNATAWVGGTYDAVADEWLFHENNTDRTYRLDGTTLAVKGNLDFGLDAVGGLTLV